jgi:hypothetical protein
MVLCANATADGWLCIGEKSSGFRYEETPDRWMSAVFGNATDSKFVVRRANMDEPMEQRFTWVVAQLGKDSIDYGCEDDLEDSGALFCKGLFGEFRFNSKSLRFQSYYAIGYVIRDPNSAEGKEIQSGNTPSLVIGRCSPL